MKRQATPISSDVRSTSVGSLGTIMVLGLALSGCATASASFSSMSDSVSSVSERSVGRLFAPKGEPVPVTMFIASTRRSGPEGTSDGHIHYSLQTVTVPPGHSVGAIERPTFGSADPTNHFVVARRRSLDDDQFHAELAAHISGRIGNSRDILLYVHGFNTSLEEARFRLAQISADGQFQGVPVLFTWPAKNELLAYESDKESATVARDALVQLLADLSQSPGTGRVHILAHSMGTWLSMEALRESAIAGRPDLGGKLGDVMLAAPDIDISVFRQQLSRLDPSHVSIFVSRSDRALSLSSKIAGDRPRLGAMDPNNPRDKAALDALGVKVHDLSELSTGFIGHDTYADAPDSVRQIGATLTRKRESDANVQAVIDAAGSVPAASPAPAPTPVPDAK